MSLKCPPIKSYGRRDVIWKSYFRSIGLRLLKWEDDYVRL